MKSINQVWAELDANNETEYTRALELLADEKMRLESANYKMEKAINLLLETVPPYKEDGTCTIPEKTVDAVNEALFFNMVKGRAK